MSMAEHWPVKHGSRENMEDLAFRYSENVAVKCSHPDADSENLVSIKQGENKTGIKDTK